MKSLRARHCFVVLAGLAIPLATASAAHASGDPDYTAVPPQTATSAPPPASVASATTAPAAAPAGSSRSSLPLTGGDVTQLTLLGAGLLAGGGIVLRARRHAAA
ncbi:MAG TPA: LPXTG cell wall anchor domain-containing protein [Acidimicrobiales bacterium]